MQDYIITFVHYYIVLNLLYFQCFSVLDFWNLKMYEYPILGKSIYGLG